MNGNAAGASGDAIVCCSVGDRSFGIRNTAVRVIARAEHVRVDRGSDGLVGRLSIGGREVPVHALGAMLNPLAEVSLGGRHVAVVEERGTMIGWLADRIARMPLAGEEAVLPLPHLVGQRALERFEGLLSARDGLPLLLLATGHSRPRDPGSPIAASSTSEAAADLAVLFSTPALPAWDAQRYAVAAARLVAVVQDVAWVAVPGAPAHVVGVGIWRGAPIAVLDYRADDARRRAGDRERFAVLRYRASSGTALMALPVDPEITLHQATRENLQIALQVEPPLFVSAVFTVGTTAVALLDVDRLVEAA